MLIIGRRRQVATLDVVLRGFFPENYTDGHTSISGAVSKTGHIATLFFFTTAQDMKLHKDSNQVKDALRAAHDTLLELVGRLHPAEQDFLQATRDAVILAEALTVVNLSISIDNGCTRKNSPPDHNGTSKARQSVEGIRAHIPCIVSTLITSFVGSVR